MNSLLNFCDNFIKDHKLFAPIMDLHINWSIIFFDDKIIQQECKIHDIVQKTLILHIPNAIYFHICHHESLIIVRINQYFSYKIINNIKVFTMI